MAAKNLSPFQTEFIKSILRLPNLTMQIGPKSLRFFKSKDANCMIVDRTSIFVSDLLHGSFFISKNSTDWKYVLECSFEKVDGVPYWIINRFRRTSNHCIKYYDSKNEDG